MADASGAGDGRAPRRPASPGGRAGPTPPLSGLVAGLRLALRAGGEAEHRDALAAVADWPALAGLAAHHRVSGLFLHGLAAGSLRVPDPAAARALTRQRRRDTLRGMRQLAAMRRVTAGLAAAGVPSLILKGLPLGQRVYGRPFVKSSIDVDLLVPGGALRAAASVLRSLGWRRTMPDFRETPARLRWYDAVEKDHVFVGAGCKIELHPRLFANPTLFHPPFDRADAEARVVEVGGTRFRTLGDADQLLYLACHGTMHYWQRLKWLCDVAALLRAMEGGAVETAAARCRAGRFGGFLAATLCLCEEELQVRTPGPARALARCGPRARFVVGASRRGWTPRARARQFIRDAGLRIARWFIGGGVRYSLHEARGTLIGRHDFSRVDLPDRFFWLYVPLRPALLLLRVLRPQGKRSAAGQRAAAGAGQVTRSAARNRSGPARRDAAGTPG